MTDITPTTSANILLPNPTGGTKLLPKLQDAAQTAMDTCTAEGESSCSAANFSALQDLQSLYKTIFDRRKQLAGRLTGTAKELFARAISETIEESCSRPPLQVAQVADAYSLALIYIGSDEELGERSSAATLIRRELEWLNKTALPSEQRLLTGLDTHGRSLLDSVTANVVEAACQYQRVLLPVISSVSPSRELRADNTNITITIQGTNFPEDVAAAFLLDGNPDDKITVSNVAVNLEKTTVTLTISIAGNAVAGERQLRLSSAKYDDLGYRDYSAVSLVTILPRLDFSITPVPAIGYQGQEGVILTIAGQRMEKVARLTVDFGAGPQDILISSTTATEITTNAFTIPEEALSGTYEIKFWDSSNIELSATLNARERFYLEVRRKPVIASYDRPSWLPPWITWDTQKPWLSLYSGITNHDLRLPDASSAITDHIPTYGGEANFGASLLGSKGLLSSDSITLDAHLSGSWDRYVHLKEDPTTRWNAGGSADLTVTAWKNLAVPGFEFTYEHVDHAAEVYPLGRYPSLFNGKDDQLTWTLSLGRTWWGFLPSTAFARLKTDHFTYSPESAYPGFKGNDTRWEIGGRIESAARSHLALEAYAITGQASVPEYINGDQLPSSLDPITGWGAEFDFNFPHSQLQWHVSGKYSNYHFASWNEVALYDGEFLASIFSLRKGGLGVELSAERYAPYDESERMGGGLTYILPRGLQPISLTLGANQFCAGTGDNTCTLQPYLGMEIKPFEFLGQRILTP